METHNQVYKEVPYKDHLGRERTRFDISYHRSEETEAEMEDYRLGILKNQSVTLDSKVKLLLKKSRQIIICSYFTARTIAATKLRLDKRVHTVLTGTDLLHAMFDKEGGSASLSDGYSTFKQLFLFFGYIEAPNSYLPSLVTQLVGQRVHLDLPVWLFIPTSLEVLAARWKNSALQTSLSFIETEKIDSLSDLLNEGKGPEATTSVKDS